MTGVQTCALPIFPAGMLCVTTGWGKTRYNGEWAVAFPPTRRVRGRGCLSRRSLQVGQVWLFFKCFGLNSYTVINISISLFKTLLMKTLPAMNKN